MTLICTDGLKTGAAFPLISSMYLAGLHLLRVTAHCSDEKQASILQTADLNAATHTGMRATNDSFAVPPGALCSRSSKVAPGLHEEDNSTNSHKPFVLDKKQG